MNIPDVSRRGVYYNLTMSPYEFKTPCGDIFKFSSAKKLEIYTRKLSQFDAKLEKLLKRHSELGGEWISATRSAMEKDKYRIIYDKVEKGL